VAPAPYNVLEPELVDALVNDLTATIKTALWANVVIHYGSTAVRASCKLWNNSFVVGSSFISALFGDFVFRMCHF